MSQLNFRDLLEHQRTLLVKSLRRFHFGLPVLFIGAAVSLLVAYQRPPDYSAQVLIAYRESVGLTEQGTDPLAVRRLGGRLREEIKARSLLLPLIQELKLYPKIVAKSGEEEAVEEMRNDIRFFTREGDTFLITYEYSNPKQTYDTVTRLAELLIEHNGRDRAERLQANLDFINKELGRVAGSLKNSEEVLNKFLLLHPEFTPTNGPWALIRAVQGGAPAGTVPDDVAALELEVARVKARLEALQAQQLGGNLATVDLQQLERLTREVQSAREEVLAKSTRFTEEHPDVRAARARLKAAEEAYANLPEQLRNSAERARLLEIEQVQKQLETLTTRLEAARARAGLTGAGLAAKAAEVVRLEQEWSKLSVEVEDLRTQREQMTNRQFQATLALNAIMGGSAAQIRVLDPAVVPDRPTKSRFKIIGLGMGTTLLLTGLVLLIGGLSDDRIYDRYEVEQLKVGPLLASLPRGQKYKRSGRVRRSASTMRESRA